MMYAQHTDRSFLSSRITEAFDIQHILERGRKYIHITLSTSIFIMTVIQLLLDCFVRLRVRSDKNFVHTPEEHTDQQIPFQ
jgi:hypothetical protein